MTQIATMERRFLTFSFLLLGAYTKAKILKGNPKYRSWRILLLARFALDSFGMANEARQRLTGDHVGFSLFSFSFYEVIWRVKETKRDRLIIVIGLSTLDCVTSAARRELAIIQRHAKAQPRQTFLLLTNYKIHPSEHTSLLSQFLQLAPHLIRPDSYCAPNAKTPRSECE